MNHTETAVLLGVIAAFDRRTTGEADVIAWQAVLHDVALDDARQAVIAHYTESESWVMPATVRNGAIRIDRQRRGRARRAELDAKLDAELSHGPPVARPLELVIGRSVPPATKEELDVEARIAARAEIEEARQRQGDAS